MSTNDLSDASGDDDAVDPRDLQITQLERALETRTTISAAVGITMERYGLDMEAAFGRLAKMASEQKRPVLMIATDLVETRHTQSSPPVRSLTYSTLPNAEAGRDQFNLSERETQVLTLIAQGRSNQEIAAALYLGLNTVKTYIRTAYRKISATRRSQAVIWAHQYGIVGPEKL